MDTDAEYRADEFDVMRYFVLPKHTNFYVRGLHVAPLRARIFFQQVFFENQNYSIRIVDGYFTFALWNSWLQDMRWTKVHDYMFSPDLIGMRCRVMVSFKTVKGTIREVDLDRKKITVELDDGPSWSDEEAQDDDEEAEEQEEMVSRDSSSEARTDSTSQVPPLDDDHYEDVVGLDDGMSDHLNRPFETNGMYYSTVGRKSTENRSAPHAASSTPLAAAVRNVSANAGDHRSRAAARSSAPSGTTAIPFNTQHSSAPMRGREKLLKVYDMGDVNVRNKPGRCQLHLNGMRMCLYNATGKYEDLRNDGGESARQAEDAKRKADEMSPHVRRIQKFFRRKKDDVADLDGNESDAARLRARGEALKLQQHQLKHKSFVQKVFDIIRCVEIETSVSSIDVGGVGSSHPYFLHTAFRTGEGRIYLAQSGVPGIDLYRLVTELTLQQVDMRMVPMDNKLTETQLLRNPTLLERTHLLFRGTADRHHNNKSSLFETSVFSDSNDIPDIIRDFGIILDGKDRSDIHLVYYRDAPNVYAGEEVVRGKIPTSCAEVLIDAQRLRYGPWLEYCRTQLWNFFLPPNFRPLQVMEFEIGKPRPVCGFDMFVEFMTNTTLEVPFKRRAPAPSPPFGIKDSKRKGMLSATIGKGSQYIQPAFFLLKGEKKQRLEALFLGKNLNVRANAVLDRDNVQFCSAETAQFFLDREDDIIWNGRKRWNILTHLFNAEVFFYMSYVDFFLDLLNDWQFAQNMYHNVPLQTETFNTLERAVRDFIPNVKRFEVFADKLKFHVNVNTNNVIYSENPNDPDQNIMATLCARNGSFSMVLPSDQYQLASENEVVRPLEAHAEDVEAFLSLPKLHPLSAISSSELRWAYCRSMDIRGCFTAIVPCQSEPIAPDNLNTTTGRTRLHNYLNLEVDITHVEGRLMGQHIKGLVNALQNLFLDHTLPIAPDELFWLLAKLQSHVALGKNKRKEFKQFLESKQPAGNDLEVAVSVTLKDVDAVACVGQGRHDAGINVSTSLLNFSYVKQFAVTDTCVTVSPITARFIDERGHIVRSPESFICVGDIAVSLIKHFGPMPFKPKVHESMDVKVQGASFSANVQQLMRLVHMTQTLFEHLKAEDPVMEAEVNEAHSVAEYAADQITVQSPGPQYGLRRRQKTAGFSEMGSPYSTSFSANGVGTTSVEVADGVDTSSTTRRTDRRVATTTAAEPAAMEGSTEDAAPVPLLEAYEEKDFTAKHTQGTFFELHRTDTERQHRPLQPHASLPNAPFSLGFADEVPFIVAEEYAEFMERVNKADEASKDYGVFCTLVSVGGIEGAVKLGDAGFATLNLPWGLTAATTTLNDGNSNNRLSVAARELSLRALIPRRQEEAAVAVPATNIAPGATRTTATAAVSEAATFPDTSANPLYHSENFLEVFLVQTSLCLRHYTAYPFDGSLQTHRAKQRQFVQENDYEQLICFAFDEDPTPPLNGANPARATPPNPASARTKSSAPTSQGAGLACSPVRPVSAPPQDPPTLARKPPQAETPSPAAAVAAAQPPPAESFTNALLHFNAANEPLFASPDRNGEEDIAAASPEGVVRNRSLVTAGAASLPNTSAGRGGGHRGLSDPANATTSCSASTASHVDAADPDLRSLHSHGTQSRDSGDTTVHVPVRDLSSLSSSSSGLASRSTAGVHTDEFADPDCGPLEAAFETCRSASSEFESSSNSSAIFDEHVPFRFGNDDADGSDSTPTGGTPGGPMQGGPATARKNTAPLTAAGFEQMTEHNFFCAYFRSSAGLEDGYTHSALDFVSMRAARTAPHREWVHANAPLPSTGFVLYSVPTNFPDYVLSEQFMQTHYTRESDLYSWASRQANNSERSANQSTTKHLHVELMEPVQMLLSRQMVCLVEAVVDAVDDTQQQLATSLLRSGAAGTQKPTSTDTIGVQDQVRKRNATAFLRPKRTKTKSRARKQQKRWLTEDSIVTTTIPCVEIKFLAALPVPRENTPSLTSTAHQSLPPFGVYSSTVAIRDVSLIIAQEKPPAGVVESPSESTQKLSASLCITSMALITQIEDELLEREGNLSVEVPNLPYDDLKDTIGVFYITGVQARVKQDTVRGTNGGACSISVDTIALHATRELVDYAKHAECVFVPQLDRIASKAQMIIASFTSTAKPTNTRGIASKRMPSGFVDSPTPIIADRSRTLQGKGSVSCVYLCMIDTRRQGDRVVVDASHPSTLTISKISTNFVLVVPNRRPGQPEYVHLTAIGEVGNLESRIFPVLVHALQPRVIVLDWERLYGAQRSGGVGASGPQGLARHVSFEGAAPPGTPTTSHGGDARSAFMNSLQSSPLVDRGAPAQKKPTREWVYNVVFTLRALDAVVAHSAVNYAQVCGKNLTGGAESRLEPMRSRECVQMEVLTESISPRLKARLRFLAHKARQRAKRSRYAAPPATTAQLQLHYTASFFTQNLVARYVVDPVLRTGSPGPGSGRDGMAPSEHVAEVIAASIDGISATFQFSEQYDLLGKQLDVHALVDKVIVTAPHHTHAEQTVNPQIVTFITSWRSAAKRVQASVGAAGSSGSGGPQNPSGAAMKDSTPSTVPSKPAQNQAMVLRLQVKQMESVLGLPQNISQRFLLPELCVFLRTSSDERVSLKLHAHPFSIVAKTSASEGYCITLPNIYLVYAHDAIKMTASIMMEPVSITITPQFINHALLAYEKLTITVGALISQTVPLDERGKVTQHAPTPMAPLDGRSVLGTSAQTQRVSVKRGRRCSFLFLWQGFRFSYLTSMSNLRLSLRKLNAIGESSQVETRKTLEWTINVTGAQIALVDRDYYDKRGRSAANVVPPGQPTSTTLSSQFEMGSSGMDSRPGFGAPSDEPYTAATSRRVAGSALGGTSALSGASKPRSRFSERQSTSSTVPPTLGRAASSPSGTHSRGTGTLVDPLAGYVWGSVELNFTLSGGKTDRDNAKSALINTSFGAYTEEMQTALMSKLGTTNAWWDLSIRSPLVLVRVGLAPLLNRCFEETRRDISFMKQAALEESNRFEVRLNRHHTFHKLQQEKRRYEALINRNRQEQMQQLKRMTGQVVLDLQRRRAGVSQGSGWDSTLYDLDISTTHRFVATVSNFMVILPFGDTAFRSVLDELPEAFSCHRADKHLHTVGCLDRRQYLPTLAFKTKIDTTSFICEMTSTKSLQLIASSPAENGAGGRPNAPPSPVSDGPAGAVVASHKFVGRFLATDTMLYFSSGAPVVFNDGASAVRAVAHNPFLLGGDGNLASSDTSEYHRARNTVHITTVDAPVHIKSTRESTSVAVMLDMSGPRVRLSPHFVTLMMELGRELPTRHLNLQPTDDSGEVLLASTDSPPTPALSRPPTLTASETGSTERRLTVDVSARLEAGDISLFSYGVEPEEDLVPSSPTAAGRGGAADGAFQRGRFPFRGVPRTTDAVDSKGTRAPMSPAGAPRSSSVPISATTARSTTAARALPSLNRRKRSSRGTLPTAAEETMTCVLQIPLPSVLVQILVRRSNNPEEDDLAAVRGEIHAGVIELGPSLGIVAREIEQTAAMHRHNIDERRKALMALVQELEKVTSQTQIRLPVTVRGLLAPLPRAYASAVLTDRSQRLASLHRSRGGTRRTEAASSKTPTEAHRAATPDTTAVVYPRRRFVTDVQVTLSDFRLVFSVEPFASTAFTVFLDERGSVDVLCHVVKELRHPLDPLPFIKKDPELSFILNVLRLRAECQTKLEVKSLEMSLPEAELVVSMREGTAGSVRSVDVNFPFNAEGSEPNLTLRMQHMSQVFTVTRIWSRILKETKESVVALAATGAKMSSGAEALAHRLGELSNTPSDLGTDERIMVIMYLSHGIASVDMGSGNAHQLLFGAIRCALEQCVHSGGAATYLVQTQIESLQMRSEGVLSGFATLRNVAVKGFVILNAEDTDDFLRSPDERTFRGTVLVQRVHVSFKERQLKDIFECRIGDLTCNVMDGIGVDGYTTSDINVSLRKGTLGVTPSTVPAVLTVLRNVSAVVSDQKRMAEERISAAVLAARKASANAAAGGQKSARRRTSSSVSVPYSPVFSWVPRPDSPDSDSPASSTPSNTAERGPDGGGDATRHSTLNAPRRSSQSLPCIAFMGNRLPRIPCGQLSVTLEETQLLLGAISSGQAASGCVVASFTKALFSFAETPCETYTAAKKVLIVETHDTELYRPGNTKVTILGFQGANHFEFYTRQVLGLKDVGFTLTLRQTHPWTGNPRFRDFEEMITLMKSFTDKKNVTAFKHFGQSDLRFPLDMGDESDEPTMFRPSAVRRATSERPASAAASASKRVASVAIVSEKTVAEDIRSLKALRTSKFSPQLRFGGDVSVNTEVILNWLGITEKMLPAVINSQLCDKLEMALYGLGARASERVRLVHDPNLAGSSTHGSDSLVPSPPPMDA